MRDEIGRLCRFYCVIEHSHKYDVVIYWSHYHLNKYDRFDIIGDNPAN